MFEEERVHFFPALGSSDDRLLLVRRAEGTVQCTLGNTTLPSAWHKSSHSWRG